MSGHVFATFSTWVTPTVQVQKGEVWDADDPVVRSHPDWFTTDASAFTRRSDMDTATANRPMPGSMRTAAPVEQATAAPGEKRVIRRA